MLVNHSVIGWLINCLIGQLFIQPVSQSSILAILDHRVVLISIVALLRYNKQQRSKPIGLEKGRVYYMEAFLKEGGGGDHLTVRVKLPSGRTQTPLMKNLYTRPPVGKLALRAFLTPR
jgi:hypothetical protein